MASLPFSQSIGQTSQCSSKCWSASTTRRHSRIERHVIYDLVADDALEVDQEKAAVCDEFAGDDGLAFFVDAIVACEDIVVFGNGFVDIRDKRVGAPLDAAVFLRGLEPCPVGKFRVRGTTDDGNAAFLKLAEFLLEAVKFGRADKGEVLWVEEEYLRGLTWCYGA